MRFCKDRDTMEFCLRICVTKLRKLDLTLDSWDTLTVKNLISDPRKYVSGEVFDELEEFLKSIKTSAEKYPIDIADEICEVETFIENYDSRDGGKQSLKNKNSVYYENECFEFFPLKGNERTVLELVSDLLSRCYELFGDGEDYKKLFVKLIKGLLTQISANGGMKRLLNTLLEQDDVRKFTISSLGDKKPIFVDAFFRDVMDKCDTYDATDDCKVDLDYWKNSVMNGSGSVVDKSRFEMIVWLIETDRDYSQRNTIESEIKKLWVFKAWNKDQFICLVACILAIKVWDAEIIVEQGKDRFFGLHNSESKKLAEYFNKLDFSIIRQPCTCNGKSCKISLDKDVKKTLAPDHHSVYAAKKEKYLDRPFFILWNWLKKQPYDPDDSLSTFRKNVSGYLKYFNGEQYQRAQKKTLYELLKKRCTNINSDILSRLEKYNKELALLVLQGEDIYLYLCAMNNNDANNVDFSGAVIYWGSAIEGLLKKIIYERYKKAKEQSGYLQDRWSEVDSKQKPTIGTHMALFSNGEKLDNNILSDFSRITKIDKKSIQELLKNCRNFTGYRNDAAHSERPVKQDCATKARELSVITEKIIDQLLTIEESVAAL